MRARTILIADDDRDTRIILRAVLERQRFVVVEATNPEDACAVVRERAPDLIILNYPMAGADGRSLVNHLRSEPASQHVPILNLTSRVVPQFLRDAEAEGVTVTVSKPIDVDAVMRLVGELLSAASVAS